MFIFYHTVWCGVKYFTPLGVKCEYGKQIRKNILAKLKNAVRRNEYFRVLPKNRNTATDDFEILALSKRNYAH